MRVEGSAFRVQGLGLRVEGLGFQPSGGGRGSGLFRGGGPAHGVAHQAYVGLRDASRFRYSFDGEREFFVDSLLVRIHASSTWF